MGDRLIVANFMDSSLADLAIKGVFRSVGETYNPGLNYRKVIHFTPHARDMSYAEALLPFRIEIIHHPAAGLSPLKILKALYLVLRTLRLQKVDVIRGRLPYLGSLIGAIAARALGIPFVVSLGGDNRLAQERNSQYYYGSKFISFWMESLVLRLAHLIIVPNLFTKDYVGKIIGRSKAEAQCAIVPWISEPIVAQTASIPESLGIDTKKRIVPIIGFLNRYKYTDVLFDAIEGLRAVEDYKDVAFIFCGDGPLRAVGEQQFPTGSGVHFVGWQDRCVVHSLISHAELVIVPMSGYVLLEAASIGKPVITSDVEWHKEIIHDGETGLVVTPTDSKAWQSAIDIQLSTPERARIMGTALKELYWSNYSPQYCIEEELSLYEALLAKKATCR